MTTFQIIVGSFIGLLFIASAVALIWGLARVVPRLTESMGRTQTVVHEARRIAESATKVAEHVDKTSATVMRLYVPLESRVTEGEKQIEALKEQIRCLLLINPR